MSSVLICACFQRCATAATRAANRYRTNAVQQQNGTAREAVACPALQPCVKWVLALLSPL